MEKGKKKVKKIVKKKELSMHLSMNTRAKNITSTTRPVFWKSFIRNLSTESFLEYITTG